MVDDDFIHPDLREAWRTRPPLELDDLERVRAEFLAAILPVEDHMEIPMEERRIPRWGSTDMLRLRLYGVEPKRNLLKPAVLWIHGGGYILGSIENDEQFCRRIAADLDAVVVTPDYRLAPEHPFPAGLEDCYTALRWVAQHVEDLWVHPRRIAVAGNSAGGGLTAALSLLARDRGGPSIAFQMPLYPMIDDRNISPSSQTVLDARAWNRERNVMAWRMYLGGGGAVSPYAAPARAVTLSGLPPTYTMVGTYDVFRDETIDYVARLARAGVPVEFHLYPGGFHAFELGVPDVPVSRRAQGQYLEALKRGLSLNNVGG